MLPFLEVRSPLHPRIQTLPLTRRQNKSYCGVNLIDFENNPTPRAVALFRSVAGLIKDRVIKPVKPVQLFSFS
jgi:hypothetical protein